MAGNGYIWLHRSILFWEWYDDINVCRLFIHLLLKANHQDNEWHGVIIKAGQTLTSIPALAKETGLTSKQIRNNLNKLKTTNEVAVKTTNKYSLITITNWASYQSDDEERADKRADKRADEGQAKGRQRASNKNDKNDKNYIPPIIPLVDDSELAIAIAGFVDFRKSSKKPMTDHAVTLLVKELAKLSDDPQMQIAILNQSIVNGWTGIYPLKDAQAKPATKYKRL